MIKPNSKYITIGGNKVFTSSSIITNITPYIGQIMQILDIKYDDNKKVQQVLQNQLIAGLTNNIVFPSGIWLAET